MELVALKSDLAFRAVFGRECDKCKKALMALLNDILQLNIKQLSYSNPLNLQNYEDDKKSEMDIEIITDQGERIDIEIQLVWFHSFAKRVVYYGSKLVNESLDEGEDYEQMKRSIVLSILDFTMFKQNDKIQNCFRFKEVEDNFELTDIIELVFLEMGKMQNDKPITAMSRTEKWLYFIKHVNDTEKDTQIQQILEESEGITMAMEILKEVSADEQLRTRIRFQEKAERDRLARLNSALAEGIELGRQQGLEEGLKEGIKEGIQEGIQEGERRKTIELAQKMLAALDDASIVQFTGLTPSEVASLRQGERI